MILQRLQLKFNLCSVYNSPISNMTPYLKMVPERIWKYKILLICNIKYKAACLSWDWAVFRLTTTKSLLLLSPEMLRCSPCVPSPTIYIPADILETRMYPENITLDCGPQCGWRSGESTSAATASDVTSSLCGGGCVCNFSMLTYCVQAFAHALYCWQSGPNECISSTVQYRGSASWHRELPQQYVTVPSYT
jgi:hypothetical protein